MKLIFIHWEMKYWWGPTPSADRDGLPLTDYITNAETTKSCKIILDIPNL
jgi:hypothetical protein